MSSEEDSIDDEEEEEEEEDEEDEDHRHESASFSSKFLLLCDRTIRYTIRQRLCKIIPLILCELFVPLLIIIIIVYISHYILNDPLLLEDQIFEDKTVSPSSKCSLKGLEIFSNETNEYQLELDCLQIPFEISDQIYSKVHLIFRYLNISKKKKESNIYQKFHLEIERKLKRSSCVSSNRLRISSLEKDFSSNESESESESESADYRSILNSNENELNILIDIKEMSSKSFDYDIIVPMPKNRLFEQRILNPIEKSYIEQLKHPSEQIDIIGRRYPPYSNIKMLIDSIGLKVMLNKRNYSWKCFRMSCKSSRHHPIIATRWTFILILFTFSSIYFFSSLYLINSIIKEKKEKIKEILKIIDISPLINSFAWATRSFFTLSILTSLILGILKMSLNGWIILENVSTLNLLIIFVIINIQLISYSILMGQFFQSYTIAFLSSLFQWLFINYISFQHFQRSNLILFFSLNPFYSFSKILILIYEYERSFNDIHWNNKVYSWNPFLSHLFFVILCSIPIYWIFIWYIEKLSPGTYGISLSWNFPFQKEYWKTNKKYSKKKHFSSIDKNIYDQEKRNRIVQIKSLIKTYSQTNRTILNNISFNLYENEITSILGHNGAGKTTLMNILCGMIEQTSGSVQIYSYDTREYFDYLRQFLSYCPQHDVLFDLLTVEEQISFHAIARGYLKEKDEICEELLRAVSLYKDRNVLCQNLSGGMKRRLSIACAFIGNTKVVLLDEPSSGLDPINRRLLWTWIRSMKKGRSILLSTHFLEEADALSDQIIILNNGQIRANDSPMKLKDFFGNGYKLILNTYDPKYNEELFQLCEKSFPFSQIEIETNNQLIIQTNNKSSQPFIPLFHQLDQLKLQKIIFNYGLTNPTLDEVFVRIIENDQKDEERKEKDEELIEENCLEIFSETFLEEGYQFYLSQFEGLIIKFYRIASRKSFFFFLICLIPFFISKYSSRQISLNDQMILIDFNSFSSFDQNDLFILINSKENKFVYSMNNNKSFSPTHFHILTNLTNIQQFDQFFSNRREKNNEKYSLEYLGIFLKDGIKGSILRSHLIIGYQAFGLITDYFCQGKCSIKTKLKFIRNLSNLEENQFSFSNLLKRFSIFGCFYGILPGEYTQIAFFFHSIIYFYLTLLILNEEYHLRKLMQTFGLHPIIFWISRFTFDFILTITYSFILFLISSSSFSSSFKQSNDRNSQIILKNFFFYTFISTMTTLPFIYLLTKLMKNGLIGALLIFVFLTLIELIDLIRVILSLMLKGMKKMFYIYWFINLIFPSLNGKRLISILLKKDWKSSCQLIEQNPQIMKEISSERELKEEDFVKYLFISLIQIFVQFLLLCLIDLKYNPKLFSSNSFKDQFNEKDLDEQVYLERFNLLKEKNREDFNDYPLISLDIIQKYPKKSTLAINHLTFHLKQGECFGLLGFNGAGKSSLYRILVGEERAKSGLILINGINYGELSSGISHDIGYCPQIDCIEEKLTVEDYFYLFGRLKGISSFHLDHYIQILSQLFLLQPFFKQYLQQLSGGTIRRMHAALACLGPPSIILLDEPTTGVDPYSRSQMRKVFEYAIGSNLSMILTSHSMEECEMLCNRLGIMSKGQFQCLGNIQDLKEKFGNIYTIDMKFNNSKSDQIFNQFQKSFKQIQIRHQTETTLIIQLENSSPAILFSFIEQIKEQFHIETYSIQQITLEQIFISLQDTNL